MEKKKKKKNDSEAISSICMNLKPWNMYAVWAERIHTKYTQWTESHAAHKIIHVRSEKFKAVAKWLARVCVCVCATIDADDDYTWISLADCE